MRIAILGTRGIPNRYGGFEQCAEYLAPGLVARGFHVVVYNSHRHPFQEKFYRGARIVHCYDPEHRIGTAGQFVYDFNCIRDLRRRNVDAVLQLGYTSSSVWAPLLPGGVAVATNMDGMEWMRSKYPAPVRRFLRRAEAWAVRSSDVLIADSRGVQDYLQHRYQRPSTYIAYGAEPFEEPDAQWLRPFGLAPDGYDLLVARLEPENSIETILAGVAAATERPFLVIGDPETRYGRYLQRKFSDCRFIRFTGKVYDLRTLNNLRWFSRYYFHGHTVGGTNPSLLEAMASGAWICAHDNPFNRAVLGSGNAYFRSADDVVALLRGKGPGEAGRWEYVAKNLDRIRTDYPWSGIIDQYAALLTTMVNGRARREQSVRDFVRPS